MRAGHVVGVAAGVLGLAVAATLVSMPPALAAGATAGQIGQPPDRQSTGVVVGRQQDPGIVVRTQRGPDVLVRRQAAPNVQVIAGEGARLGVQIRDLTNDDVATLKLPSLNGVAVVEVTKDSAAERAGVKANDVIVVFDDETVRSAQQLTRLVRETAPGRTVKMTVVRDGKRVDLNVEPTAAPPPFDVLVDRNAVRTDIERQMQELRNQLRQYRGDRLVPAPTPPTPRAAPAPPGGAPQYRQWTLPPDSQELLRRFNRELPGALDQLLSPGRARLGVRVQELTSDLATYFGVTAGVLVSSVDADTPAAKAGLKAGDVITAIDGQAVTSPTQLVERLRDKEGEVAIAVTREKKALTLKATLEPLPRRQGRVIIAGRPV